MNCETFGNFVVELARSQPLEAGVRDEALAHCSDCQCCSQRLEDEKMLSAGLQALAVEMKAGTAPDRLEQNLIMALRQQRFVPQAAHASHRWNYLAIAAAVIIAVMLAIAGFRMRESKSESHAQAVPPIETPTTNMPTGDATPTSDEPAIVIPELKRAANKKTTPHVATNPPARKRRNSVTISPTFVSVVVGALTDSDSSEVVSPFMPLGYTNDANLQEGAQVMRVELPRYAMARFGLPVNMERYDERVKADVWVGADGLARAIRFVQ